MAKTKKGKVPEYLSGDKGQGTTPLRVSLDLSSLAKWLVTQPALRSLILASCKRSDIATDPNVLEQHLNARQFGFGQSNPTFLLQINCDEADLQLVIRKKPQEVAHASAHALHREYRVLKALYYHNQLHNHLLVPIPEVYAYCKDKEVLGAEFYVMEYVKGTIFTDPSMPKLSRNQRVKAYQDVIKVLANLHSVDCNEVGLSDYGRPSRYVERQLDRLLAVSRKQSELAGEKQNIERIGMLANQLKKYATYCPQSLALCHGDFKIDNLIFDCTTDEPKVIGVLDWGTMITWFSDYFCLF
jgi:aminoglycoside phosphotransferase (APT) family kinase protein